VKGARVARTSDRGFSVVFFLSGLRRAKRRPSDPMTPLFCVATFRSSELNQVPAFVLSVLLSLILLGLYYIPEDRQLAQRLARLQPVQTLHEDEAFAIAPDLDWGRLPLLKYAFGNLSHNVRL
jgi:hypothetical protein